MVNLKYNADKDTYSLKGLSDENLKVLSGLLNQTTLGSEPMPNAAFEVLQELELYGVEPCDVSVTLDSQGYFSLTVE